MNLDIAVDVLEFNLQRNTPCIMLGSPGVGKSSVVHQIAERRRAGGKKFGLVDFRAILRDPVDLRGLPTVAGDYARWLAPHDLPQVERDGEEGILFLDEINAANPSMQAACFGLVLDRKVGEYVLPPGWRIVAAGNHISDRASAQKMATALINRFNLIEVEADQDTFTKYANLKGLPPELIAFIRFRPNLLLDMKSAVDGKPFPTPRSWEQAAKAINAPAHIRPYLLQGDVGSGAALEFEGFLRVFSELPSIDQVISAPDTTRVPDESAISARYAVVSALASRATKDNFENILRYAKRMPREFATMLVVDAARRDNSLTHTAAFTKWATENADVTM